MTGPADLGRELTSWKEIAAYLGVSVRTAQLWERQRGMPVRRLTGGRGRVAAHTAELEAWKRSLPAGDPPIGPAAPSVTRRRWLQAGGALMAVAAVPGYFGLARRSRSAPASARVEDRTLTVFDGAGRQLWTHVAGQPLRPIRPRDMVGHERVWFADIDGDGRTEVFYSKVPRECRELAPSLMCFSDTGRLRWEYVPATTVATARETFRPPYLVRDVRAGNLGGRGMTIAVCISHCLSYPSAVVLLSPDGKLLSEYWHPGSLTSVEIADFDGDGRVDIAVTGTHNASAEALLVLLDPDRFGGAAAVTDPHYQFMGLPAAHEKQRIFFPRSCVNRASQLRNIAWNVALRPGGFSVEVGEGIGNSVWASVYYHFDKGLELVEVESGEAFRKAHEQLEKSGLLDHPFSSADAQQFRTLRYTPERKQAAPPAQQGRAARASFGEKGAAGPVAGSNTSIPKIPGSSKRKEAQNRAIRTGSASLLPG